MKPSSAALCIMFCCAVSAPSSAAGKERAAASVVVATVQQKVLAPTLWVTAKVVSQSDADVAAEVAGKLLWHREVGETVEKGDVLARFDSLFAKQRLRQLRAKLNQQRAREKYVQQEIVRLAALQKISGVSSQEVEQKEMELAVLAAELESAKIDVALQQITVQRFELRAPFSGVVTSLLLNQGEWVKEGQAVLRLVNLQQLEIQLSAPIKLLPYLATGEKLELSHRGESLTTRIKRVVSAAESNSQQIELRLLTPEHPWVVGEALRVAVPAGVKQLYTVVPRDALVLRRDGAALFRVNDQHQVEKIKVELGVASGAEISVIGAISAGERVVTRGNERLRPGQTVRINSDQDKQ